MAKANISHLQEINPRTLFKQARADLVKELKRQGIQNPQVLAAIKKVPRHWFLDESIAKLSYDNVSLPIGYEQTISQPYVVARMTELLIENQLPEKVLEIGTGSGYQTAVLAELIVRVFTIERIQSLSLNARRKLRAIDLQNIHFRRADGGRGWQQFAPFDAILITAAAEEVPSALIDQLKDGGRLVAPLGSREMQQLNVIERDGLNIKRRQFDAVRFVPLL